MYTLHIEQLYSTLHNPEPKTHRTSHVARAPLMAGALYSTQLCSALHSSILRYSSHLPIYVKHVCINICAQRANTAQGNSAIGIGMPSQIEIFPHCGAPAPDGVRGILLYITLHTTYCPESIHRVHTLHSSCSTYRPSLISFPFPFPDCDYQ